MITKMFNLYKGDCLEYMSMFPDKSIDFILTDPPYGITNCKWDSIIPFDSMWEQVNRVIKPNGAIAIFGSEPFSSNLRISNIKNFKYDWIWEKTKGGNFIQAKNMPIKIHEIISIFSNGVVIHKGQSNKRMIYYPQGVEQINETWSRPNLSKSEHGYIRPSHKKERVIKERGFPKSIIKIGSVHNSPFHPTQKPVPLLEYLINTYTIENETVLDFTMGSGSTGVACANINRKFIGIELNEKYFSIAEKRIQESYFKGELFNDYQNV